MRQLKSRHPCVQTGLWLSVCCAVLLLSGCQEHNPLLGHWKLIKTAEINASAFKIAQISGNGDITFEETRMLSGNYAMDVSYTVNENEVTVHYSNGEKNAYVVENNDHFTFDIPKVGTFRYVRVKSTTLTQ